MRSDVVQQNIAFIVNCQLPDGGFSLSSQPNAAIISATVQMETHALLLDLLQLLHDQSAQKVAKRLAGYLAALVSHADFAATDTQALFHALGTLHTYDDHLIAPELTAAAIRWLVGNELAVGGPYRNALAQSDQPEFTTNLSIAQFINRLGGPFPKLDAYLAAHAAHIPPNPYYAEMWLLALRLDEHDRFAALLGHPKSKKTPPAQGETHLFRDPQLPGARFGSIALDVAAQLVAVQLRKESVPTPHATPNTALALAFQTANTLPPAITPTMRFMLARVAQADTKQEIGPMTERLASSLITSKPPKSATLHLLGAANLYNWVAYTIYDDFLDEEGKPPLLPAANAALRTSVELFARAIPGRTFTGLVRNAFNTVDAANAWELAHCRFAVRRGYIVIGELPDYGDLHNLYERSFTHGLPVAGVLTSAGVAPASVQAVMAAFRDYLVLRQLNDDLRDWKDDLAAGQISYVVARTLAAAGVTVGRQALAALMPALEQTFWHYTVPTIAKEAQQRKKSITEQLAASAILKTDNPIAELANSATRSVQQLAETQAAAKQFLKAYGAVTPAPGAAE